MNTAVLPQAHRGEPDDLTGPQKGWLVALVLAAHAVLAVSVLNWQTPVVVPAGSSPIEVSLVYDAPPAPQPTPPAPKAEVKPVEKPVVKPVPQKVQPTPQPAPVIAAAAKANEAAEVAQTPPPVAEAPPAAAEAAPAAAPAPAAAAALGPAVATPSGPPGPQVVPSSAVRYLVEPRLVYPRISRDLGEAGEVLLRVLVDDTGRARDVVIDRSSGYPRLDQQAVQAMSKARFQPYLEGGVPRTVWVKTKLRFDLEQS